MVSVSVCICAYNEERNIEHSVRSVYSQRTDGFEIAEVIVVSSGSTDRTDEIVTEMTKEFPSLVLIRQETRSGKNSAINEFLSVKKGSVSVLLNADNILRDETSLYHIIRPFDDDKVGIVGGHPIPTNDPSTAIGFVVHMMWTKHHHVSMIRPNIGELVAFRNIDMLLPTNTQTDEAMIKMELEKRGYRSVYAPDAVVLNRGPETVSDFISQRARVIVGEEFFLEKHRYVIRSRDKGLLVDSVFGTVRDLGVHPFKMSFAVLLEIVSRLRAKEHMRNDGKDISVWDRVGSTKNVKKD